MGKNLTFPLQLKNKNHIYLKCLGGEKSFMVEGIIHLAFQLTFSALYETLNTFKQLPLDISRVIAGFMSICKTIRYFYDQVEIICCII